MAEIKVKFGADPRSLEGIRSEIKHTVGEELKNQSISIKDINLGDAANKLVSSLNDALSKVDFSRLGDSMTGVNSGIQEIVAGLKEVSGTLSNISRSMPGAGLTDMVTRGTAALGMMTGQLDSVVSRLNEINGLVDSLNNKDFNLTQVVNNYTKKGGTDANWFARQRQYAEELKSVVNEIQTSISNANRSVKDQIGGDAYKQSSAIEKYATPNTLHTNAGVISGITEMNSVIQQGIEYIERYNAKARELGTNELPMPDMARVQESIRRIEEYERALQSADGATQQHVSQAGEDSAVKIGEDLNTIRGLLGEVNAVFDTIRENINGTFDFTNAKGSLEELRREVLNLASSLENINVGFTAALKSAGQSTDMPSANAGERQTEPVTAVQDATVAVQDVVAAEQAIAAVAQAVAEAKRAKAAASEEVVQAELAEAAAAHEAAAAEQAAADIARTAAEAKHAKAAAAQEVATAEHGEAAAAEDAASSSAVDTGAARIQEEVAAHERAAEAAREHADAEREVREAMQSGGGGAGGNGGGGGNGGDDEADRALARAVFLRQVADELRGIETTLAKNPATYAVNYEEISGSINALEGALNAGRDELSEWSNEASSAGEATEEMLVKIRALRAELARRVAQENIAEREAQAQTQLADSVVKLRTQYELLKQSQNRVYQDNRDQIEENLRAMENAGEVTRNEFTRMNSEMIRLNEQVKLRTDADAQAKSTEREVQAQTQLETSVIRLRSAYEQLKQSQSSVYQENKTLIEDNLRSMENASSVTKQRYLEMQQDMARLNEQTAQQTGAQRDTIAEINQSEAITKLLTQYEQLKQQHKTVYEANKADIDAYIAKMQNAGSVTEEEYARMKAAMAGYQREVKTGAEAQEKAAAKEANAQKKIDALRNKVSNYINNNTKAYQMFRGQLDSIRAELSSGSEIAPERLAQIANELANIQTAANQAGVAGQTFFQKLQSGWQKFGGWTLVTRSFMKVVQTAKQMVASVREIDAAMTELRKVTDLTSVGYERFYEQAAVAAKNVGATVSDTINATADFARLGYDVSEALPLAEAALVYKNVGDGINDVSQATESLISTIKAFGLEAGDAMSIVDRFNEVGKLLPMPVVTRCLAECYIGQSSVCLLCA